MQYFAMGKLEMCGEKQGLRYVCVDLIRVYNHAWQEYNNETPHQNLPPSSPPPTNKQKGIASPLMKSEVGGFPWAIILVVLKYEEQD